MAANRRVAIIGGGLSGLVTAVKIHQAAPDIELTVLEAAARTGGVIHTEQLGGFLVDHGADMFATEPAGVLELCREIGIDHCLIEPQQERRGASIVHRGRLIAVPAGFVVIRATRRWPMLTTPLLSVRGKLRLLAEPWIKPAACEDESIGDFVRRRMGREVLDRIVAPLAAGIYTGDVDQLSMRATMGPIAEMERRYGSLSAARRAQDESVNGQSAGARYSRFRSFRGGMIELIRGLTEALPAGVVSLNSPVAALARHDQSLLVRTTAGESVPADHVVVATPAPTAARLLEELAPAAVAPLSSIESASTAIVVLGVRRGDIASAIDTFGFVVPPAERRQILAGSFASHKFAGRAAPDEVLIRVFFGGVLQAHLLQHSDDELIQIARGELAELIGLRGTPRLTRVVRWNQAMPQYTVGHLRRVEQIERELAAVPDVTLVSNALHGVGIAPVVATASRAADEVLARCGLSNT